MKCREVPSKGEHILMETVFSLFFIFDYFSRIVQKQRSVFLLDVMGSFSLVIAGTTSCVCIKIITKTGAVLGTRD